MRATRRIHVSTLATLAAINADDLPKTVNDYGTRKQWVGFGWVAEGRANGTETAIVNRNCLNQHPVYGLCDAMHGHRGPHRCESPLAPRGKRYRLKARWTSAEGSDVPAEKALTPSTHVAGNVTRR